MSIKSCFMYITVEPVLFLYMMAFMITHVSEDVFHLYRTCLINHGYSENLCSNISHYKEINSEVQVTLSVFKLWNGIAQHAIPVILAFYIGSYSDKRGRKCIILLGLLGKFYFSIMMTVNTLLSWPVESIIYTATLPSSLTGADLAIFAGCFAYLADVTSVENRTMRVGMLDAIYLSTMPVGMAIGKILFNTTFHRSFTAMFALNSFLMLLSIICCLCFLEWQTKPEQKSVTQANVTNLVMDFFDSHNIKMTMKTLFKKQTHNRQLLMWLFLISMALYTFQRSENQYIYPYTSKMFSWNGEQLSNFMVYRSACYVLIMLVGIPLMSKIFKWKDMIIVILSAEFNIFGHLIYAHASKGQMMYVGATVAALGPCIAPLLRSMISKVISANEKGVAYTALSVMENLSAVLASILYSQLYKNILATSYLNSFFYLTIVANTFVLILAIITALILRGNSLEKLSQLSDQATENL